MGTQNAIAALRTITPVRVPRGKAPSQAALGEGQVWTVGVRVGVCISCLTDIEGTTQRPLPVFQIV